MSNVIAGGVLRSTTLLLEHAAISCFSRIVLFGAAGHPLQRYADGHRIDFAAQRLLPDALWRSHHTNKIFDSARLAAGELWRQCILPRAAKHQGVQVLFCPNTLAPLLHSSLRIVVSQHNMLPFDDVALALAPTAVRQRQLLLRGAHVRSLQRAEGIIFISEHAKVEISKRADLASKQCAVIYNGIDEGDRSKSSISTHLDGEIRILYVSSIDFYKQHSMLIRAIAGLPQPWRASVRLILAGWPHEPFVRNIQDLSEQLGLRDQVEYKGLLDRATLRAEYENADLFVFPSLCENCPTALQEAMAYGLPILASALEPMPELLGDSAIYADPMNEDTFRDGILRLLEDSVLREQLSYRARKRATHFRISERCAEMYQFLETVHG